MGIESTLLGGSLVVIFLLPAIAVLFLLIALWRIGTGTKALAHAHQEHAIATMRLANSFWNEEGHPSTAESLEKVSHLLIHSADDGSAP
jgi:hypothetical protein